MKADPAELLASLVKEYWEARLAFDPTFATVLGERGYDDRLQDVTPEGIASMAKDYESYLNRCAGIPEEVLSREDRVTLAALRTDINGQIDFLSCHLEEWTVDPLGGPQTEFQNLESFQPVRNPKEGAAMVKRWRAMGPFFDDHISNLRRGEAGWKVAVRSCVEKVIQEIQELMAKPDSEWALLKPLSAAFDGWSEAERVEFREGLEEAVRGSARPGYARYLSFLESEILPLARLQERPGIVHTPGGDRSYARLIRFHTSLDLTPDELHRTGLSEVARINAEMVELGDRVFGIRDRTKIIHRLRTDPSLYFSSRDEVAGKAEASLARAREAIPEWFGRLPKADCQLMRMEEHEEKNSTIAYYRQPAADGSRPGRYYINTSAPETRPRYEAEALAFHESIPGHHLQIAIAQELDGIPEFRRNGGVTAFVEGWGLYSERLADKMGLYSSDLDRIGMLSYDAWRACRLVVDTGMHSMGWSRSQAIAFMLENTALAENNIVNEVDRYIAWPGQALAYKTGQLEMLRLRKDTEERLGSRFDVKDFHDALLGQGALPLPVLRQAVERLGP